MAADTLLGRAITTLSRFIAQAHWRFHERPLVLAAIRPALRRRGASWVRNRLRREGIETLDDLTPAQAYALAHALRVRLP